MALGTPDKEGTTGLDNAGKGKDMPDEANIIGVPLCAVRIQEEQALQVNVNITTVCKLHEVVGDKAILSSVSSAVYGVDAKEVIHIYIIGNLGAGPCDIITVLSGHNLAILVHCDLITVITVTEVQVIKNQVVQVINGNTTAGRVTATAATRGAGSVELTLIIHNQLVQVRIEEKVSVNQVLTVLGEIGGSIQLGNKGRNSIFNVRDIRLGTIIFRKLLVSLRRNEVRSLCHLCTGTARGVSGNCTNGVQLVQSVGLCLELIDQIDYHLEEVRILAFQFRFSDGFRVKPDLLIIVRRFNSFIDFLEVEFIVILSV